MKMAVETSEADGVITITARVRHSGKWWWSEVEIVEPHAKLELPDALRILADELERNLTAPSVDDGGGGVKPWYLLYYGSSVDGRGFPSYVGRTELKSVARDHYTKCSQNPYCTGFVDIVTDDKVERASQSTDWLALPPDANGAR